jgi:hypothetical protein
LDLGGKCVVGSQLLVKVAVDRKGMPVGANGVSPQYGTPKCELIAQLVKVPRLIGGTINDDDANDAAGGADVWVGAHPTLGEDLAAVMLSQGLLDVGLGAGPVASSEREVRVGTRARQQRMLFRVL